MLIGARTAAWLPYDAEVEYLQNDDYCYIDTGIVPNNVCTEIKFALTQTGQNGQTAGCHNPNDQRYYPCELSTAASGNGFRVADRYDRLVSLVSAQDTSDHIVSYYSGATSTFDSRSFTSNNFAISSAIYTALLFGVSAGGVYSSANRALMKLYYCKMTDNATGNLLRDFIPVRKGTVGYMYDRVSRKLFGNGGTGAFIIGPDKT